MAIEKIESESWTGEETKSYALTNEDNAAISKSSANSPQPSEAEKLQKEIDNLQFKISNRNDATKVVKTLPKGLAKWAFFISAIIFILYLIVMNLSKPSYNKLPSEERAKANAAMLKSMTNYIGAQDQYVSGAMLLQSYGINSVTGEDIKEMLGSMSNTDLQNTFKDYLELFGDYEKYGYKGDNVELL